MDTHLPVPLNHLLQRELEPDEEVAWRGQPRPRLFVGQALASFLFGIPWTAFALFWTASAAGFTLPSERGLFTLFPLFGVPFILVGLGMLSAPFVGWYRLRHTAYAITDRRVILIEDGRKLTVRSFTPEQLDEIQRTEHAGGTGDVAFTRRHGYDLRGRAHSEAVALIGVQEPQRVERLLRALAAARKV